MSGVQDLQEIEFTLKNGIIAGQQRVPSGTASRHILLLHGWQDNSNSYKRLVALLPNHWWLVAIDWPGHGKSSPRPPGSAYHVSDWLTDVRQVILKLGWKRYDLIGHSMGAGVALMYASLFPEDVEAVVSLDVVKQLSEPPDPEKGHELLSAKAQKQGAIHKTLRNAVDILAKHNLEDSKKEETFSRDGAVDWWFERNKQFMSRDAANILLDRGLNESEQGKFQISRDTRLTFPPLFRLTLEQHRAVLKELKCDLLIIKAAGAQNWEATEIDQEFLESYAKNCGKFKHVHVDGLHHVHLDNPESVASHIIEFLKRH